MKNYSNNKVTFFDTNGNILIGKVQFLDHDTNQSATIYDEDGQILANPVMTNDLGQLSTDVYLENKNYLVSFYDDEDVFQYSTVETISEIKINTDDYNGMVVLDSIEDLKNFADFSKPVVLNGYYTAGDKPAIVYVWKDTDETGNYGSVVSSNVQGNWYIVIDKDYVDVRHFGCFSSDEPSMEQSYRIQQANLFANSLGLKTYFPYGTYLLNELDIECITDKYVNFVLPTGTESDVNSDSYFFVKPIVDTHVGKLNLSGNVSYTSQNLYSSNQINLLSKTVNVDKDLALNLSNQNVNISVDVSAIDLENCNIECSAKFIDTDNILISNCYVNGSWFDTIDNIRFVNCWTDKESWNDFNKYVQFCLKSGIKNIDLNGNTVSGHLFQNCSLMNGSVNNSTITASSLNNVETTNCSFSGKITALNSSINGTGNPNLNCDNCSISLTTFSGKIRDCEVSNDISGNSLVAYDSTFMNATYTDLELHNCSFFDLSADALTCMNSIMNGNVVTRAIEFNGNTVKAGNITFNAGGFGNVVGNTVVGLTRNFWSSANTDNIIFLNNVNVECISAGEKVFIKSLTVSAYPTGEPEYDPGTNTLKNVYVREFVNPNVKSCTIEIGKNLGNNFIPYDLLDKDATDTKYYTDITDATLVEFSTNWDMEDGTTGTYKLWMKVTVVDEV